MTGREPRPLGRFEVRAEPSEAVAFRAATGMSEGGEALPLAFPIRWLAAPAIRAALAAMAPEPGFVLVHESQTFDYDGRLQTGETYTLALAARREAEPDRLVVDATILAADGARRARCETVLRLFSHEDAGS